MKFFILYSCIRANLTLNIQIGKYLVVIFSQVGHFKSYFYTIIKEQ